MFREATDSHPVYPPPTPTLNVKISRRVILDYFRGTRVVYSDTNPHSGEHNRKGNSTATNVKRRALLV